MPVFASTLAPQLAAFKRQVAAVTRRVLLGGGRRFRARMMRERLSGPPGLYRKSGRLQRSLRYTVYVSPAESALRAVIGGTIAYYAAQHEASGRLGFRRVFVEEARKTVEELRMALQFVSAGAGESFGVAEAIAGSAMEVPEMISAADLAREKEWTNRFDPTTRRGQKFIQGRARWMKSMMKKYEARAGAKTRFVQPSKPTGAIDWEEGRRIESLRPKKPPKLGGWKSIIEHRAPKPRRWRW